MTSQVSKQESELRGWCFGPVWLLLLLLPLEAREGKRTSSMSLSQGYAMVHTLLLACIGGGLQTWHRD